MACESQKRAIRLEVVTCLSRVQVFTVQKYLHIQTTIPHFLPRHLHFTRPTMEQLHPTYRVPYSSSVAVLAPAGRRELSWPNHARTRSQSRLM